MTAALGNTAPGTPFATGVDSFVYPQFIGYALRPPTTQDIYNPGTRWQDNSVNPPNIYQTTGAGVWYVDSGTPGVFTSLTVTPGPISLTGTTSINTSGSAVTTIGTGGTGAVNIGNATGNTAVTGSLTASTGLVATTGGVTANAGNITATAGNIVASAGNITATLGNITAAAGNISATAGSVSAGTSVTAGTTVTATLGAITATNGNFVKGTAGNKDIYNSVATDGTAGANSAGTATLAGGTITINTTAVTASSFIRLYRQSVGATGAAALGFLSIGTVVAGASFQINAVQAADATALQATDVSVVAWEIVN